MAQDRALIVGLTLLVLVLCGCGDGSRGPGDEPPPRPMPAPINPPPRPPQPSLLSATPAGHDFGEVFDDQKVVHRFSIRNTHDGPVQLLLVQTSCACTAGQPMREGAPVELPMMLPAGQRLQLPVTVDARGRRGKQELWVTLQHLRPGDYEPRFLRIKLTGRVRQEVDVVTYVYFGKVRQGQAATRTVILSGFPADGFTVEGIVSSSPVVTATVGPRQPPTREGGPARFALSIGLTAQAPLGRIEEKLALRTSSRRQPIVTITVRADVEGPVRAIPDRVSIGPITPEGGHRAQMVTLVTPDVAVRVLAVETSIPYLQWSRLPPRPRRTRLRFAVVDPPAGTRGRVDGQIKIRTDSPAQPTIRVPVTLHFSNPED